MLKTTTFFRRSTEPRTGSSLQPVPVDGTLPALHVPGPLARIAPPVWLYGLAVFAAA